MIIATWGPYISLYLQEHGWTGAQIGIFAGIGPLVTLITQPLWGLLGDAWGNVRLLYALLLGATGLVVFAFGFIPIGNIFFLLAVLMGITHGPLQAMLDSLAVQTLGQEKNRIGQARLWGSFSFATVSLLMGYVIGLYNSAIFWGYLITSILGIAAAHLIPVKAGPKVKQMQVNISWSSFRRIASKPFIGFLGAVFILQLGHQIVMQFLSLILVERGASTALVGYAWSLTAIIEIPIFAATAWFLRKREPEWLLIVSAMITTVRLGILYLIQDPALTVVVHIAEGLAIPLFTVSIVLIVDKLVPPELKTTGFTLQAALSITLPRFLSGLLGGYLYDNFGGDSIFLVGSFLTLTGVIAIIMWQVTRPKVTDQIVREHES